VAAGAPLALAPGGGNPAAFEHAFELASLAPLLPGGFSLVGELGKAVRVSPDRFTALSAGARRPACG
jgi:hypothetical protein